MDLRDESRHAHLYFVTEENRVVYIPQGWGDEFKSDEEDGPELYGYIGQPDVNNWLSRDNREWFTWEANGWLTVEYLSQLRRVDETEARRTDPDLFRLLDAINSGEAN